MGYYLRYFADRVVALDALDRELRALDSRLRIEDGLLFREQERFGEVDVGTPGQSLYDEELDEMIASVEDAAAASSTAVVDRLRRARTSIVVRVLFGNRGTEGTLEVIDRVWQAAEKLSPGLLQADGEGFYDGADLVVAVS